MNSSSDLSNPSSLVPTYLKSKGGGDWSSSSNPFRRRVSYADAKSSSVSNGWPTSHAIATKSKPPYNEQDSNSPLKSFPCGRNRSCRGRKQKLRRDKRQNRRKKPTQAEVEFKNLLEKFTTEDDKTNDSTKERWLNSLNESKYDDAYLNKIWESSINWTEGLYNQGKKFKINRGKLISTSNINLDAFKLSIATLLLESDDKRSAIRSNFTRRVTTNIQSNDDIIERRDRGNAWGLKRVYKVDSD
ncbi:uncharacterized protein I206_104638 [Kwoniella pini CBS 10737]|uniref:Uncharacterized protein n=1 Tax=Kwoniella pini CBS 10737 TaxID=1296096 RepID=A0A1B9I7C7_9TREE|nr:uncharacterized protein I206_02174 [Kwoniella pini CBS 10737]OCF51460.1 hypothetical protein I206_02174 [Kwoniella pini CBS 10737]